MVEIAAITLATLFATVSPIDISAIFAALTSEYSDVSAAQIAEISIGLTVANSVASVIAAISTTKVSFDFTDALTLTPHS